MTNTLQAGPDRPDPDATGPAGTDPDAPGPAATASTGTGPTGTGPGGGGGGGGEAGGGPPGAGAPTSTWRISWSGLRTVAVLELRQRVRSTRWVLVLVTWAALLGGLATMLHLAVLRSYANSDQGDRRAGALMFGLTVLLVLSLGSLIAPALSATSVNGDRTAGVLASLQVTLLTPAEIALGKLAAAWLTALALLAVALPFIGWAYASGGTPVGRLLTCLALLATTLLVVCAIGLGWSAVTARTTSSAVLTYLTVAMLGLGLPVLFALSAPLTVTNEIRTIYYLAPADGDTPDPTAPAGAAGQITRMVCRSSTERASTMHTERIWWLLAPNPYVLIADAAPRPADTTSDDVLSGLRGAVRQARLGPEAEARSCLTTAEQDARNQRREDLGDSLAPIWPYGMAADLGLGAGAVVLAVRRLRTPSRRLPRNTRVA